ncbi:MAG TPA: GNAT family N-acetyltransferase [Allosphingosinicella sp.]|nr:GNAT family N-acetyltransferase [Allosphingosinicella sp.]
MISAFPPAHRYRFRPLAPADLPLVRRWRAMPHVRQWWDEPGRDEADKLADPRVAMWIVEWQGRPFAFAQDYDVHGWQPHPFAYLPAGARGIDQYIGEPDMLDSGHGSAFVAAHAQRLFGAGAPAVGTDPHPDNLRARRAYAKAGFAEASGPVETPWGRAILMERWPGAAA